MVRGACHRSLKRSKLRVELKDSRVPLVLDHAETRIGIVLRQVKPERSAGRTMKRPERKVEFAASVETESPPREVQLLINVAEPDPAYQPFIAIRRRNIALKSYMTILHCLANEKYLELLG
jgi:hypothetical protein